MLTSTEIGGVVGLGVGVGFLVGLAVGFGVGDGVDASVGIALGGCVAGSDGGGWVPGAIVSTGTLGRAGGGADGAANDASVELVDRGVDVAGL